MKPYRTGIIGLGRISSTIDDEVIGHPSVLLPMSHMGCFREVDEIEVVAGADPYESQREAFSQRWGVDTTYADYRDMLASENLDIVSIATSAKPRHQILLDVASAGVKAIYAEKPLAISLADADEMVEACKIHNTVLAVGCTRRWHPYWTMVRSMIADGEIGNVLQINAHGNAGISHNGSHMLDLVRSLAGSDVEWVVGEAESDEAAQSDNDLRMNGYLAFSNDARAFVRTWSSGPADWSVDVVGDSGMIRSVGNGAEFEVIRAEPRKTPSRSPLPRPQRIESAGTLAVRDIINCIETGKIPECSGEDGVAVLETAIALRESHRQGNSRTNMPIKDRTLAIHSMETLGGDVPRLVREARDSGGHS